MNLSRQKAALPDAFPVAGLLDEVTIQLHQRGILQWEYPWDPNKIKEDIRLGRVWACWDDSFLAGTFSLRPLQKALYPSDQAAPDRRWYLYRIALHPSYQGMGIGRTLIHFACHLADSAQKDLYLDCWAGNHSLRKFYSSAGFDPIGIFSEQDYKICVFSRPFARNP